MQVPQYNGALDSNESSIEPNQVQVTFPNSTPVTTCLDIEG